MSYLTPAILALALLVADPANANTCIAGKLLCATKMPVGGYCQCTAHGDTQDGTAASTPPAHQPLNATAGGCNINPKAPGC